MPIFKLSAPETVRLLSGHILPRNESKFTHSRLYFKKFSRGETPDPYVQKRGREGEGIKGFILLKEVHGTDRGGARGMGGEKEGEAAAGGILLQGLKGDRRPWT